MSTHDVLMESSWLDKLKQEFSCAYMQKLQEFLREERKQNQTIYPPEPEIFNAFYHASFNDTKVILENPQLFSKPF